MKGWKTGDYVRVVRGPGTGSDGRLRHVPEGEVLVEIRGQLRLVPEGDLYNYDAEGRQAPARRAALAQATEDAADAG